MNFQARAYVSGECAGNQHVSKKLMDEKEDSVKTVVWRNEEVVHESVVLMSRAEVEWAYVKLNYN